MASFHNDAGPRQSAVLIFNYEKNLWAKTFRAELIKIANSLIPGKKVEIDLTFNGNPDFDLLSKRIFDFSGMGGNAKAIFCGGDLANSVNDDFIPSLCARSGFAKTVTLSVPTQNVPGNTNILVDNGQKKTGTYLAVDHLIKVHGFTKIAFVTGPEGNEEAENRRKGYELALRDNKLAVNPSLIVVSRDWSRKAGSDAVEKLGAAGVSYEAIVASSDEQADAAIKALQQKSVSVPKDVAVVGFDNLAGFNGMTTIDQNLTGLLTEAVRSLEGGTEGEGGTLIVPSLLIARNSCGCNLAKDTYQITAREKKEQPAKMKDLFRPGAKAEAVSAFSLRDHEANLIKALEERLGALDAPILELSARVLAYVAEEDSRAAEGEIGDFLKTLTEMLKESQGRQQIARWKSALNLLLAGTFAVLDRADGGGGELHVKKLWLAQSGILKAFTEQEAIHAKQEKLRSDMVENDYREFEYKLPEVQNIPQLAAALENAPHFLDLSDFQIAFNPAGDLSGDLQLYDYAGEKTCARKRFPLPR